VIELKIYCIRGEYANHTPSRLYLKERKEIIQFIETLWSIDPGLLTFVLSGVDYS